MPRLSVAQRYIYRPKPSCERQACAMHYGFCGYGCLAAAAFTLTNMTCTNWINLPSPTLRADESLRKSFSVQITPLSILCCEPFSKLFECDLQRLGHPKATRFSDMLLFYSLFCPFVWTVIYIIWGFAGLSRYAYIFQ